jgi:hypothetical protein
MNDAGRRVGDGAPDARVALVRFLGQIAFLAPWHDILDRPFTRRRSQ